MIPRIVMLPRQMIFSALQPTALKRLDRELRAHLKPGETTAAWDITKQGNVWLATTHAVHIRPSPKKAKSDPSAVRIPYERILSIEELTFGHEVHRVLRCFPLVGGWQASETGTDTTPLTDVVRQHIEALVSDRISVDYQDRQIHLVRRMVEPNHRLYWYLEGYDEGLDATSESFTSAVDSVLEEFNAST